MQIKTFISVNKVKIRLTSERLNHILTNHPEITPLVFDLEKTLENPDFIFEGSKNEYLAVKRRNSFYLVVIYKEDKEAKDGFIITAYKTTGINYLLRKKIIWKKK